MLSRPAGTTFSPSALGTARRVNRISLAELARRLDVSRQYLQLVESGQKVPSPLLIDRIAETLGFRHEFLCRPVSAQVPVDRCFFRSPRRTRGRDKDQARAYVELFRELVVHLIEREAVRFPQVQLPHVNAARSEKDIEDAAAQCRALMGIAPDKPIRNLTRAVERCGIFVIDLEGVDPDIDAFSVAEEPRVVVRSTLKGSTSRARYDLAHELGHFVLHDAVLGTKEQEREADLFASALLLPPEAVRREFPRSERWNWRELFLMKARWGASVGAIVMRARALGLITAERTTSAWVYMSMRGWKRGPEPEEPAVELPELLVFSFREIFRVRGVRPMDVVDQLGWTPETFERVVGLDASRQLSDLTGGAVILKLPGS